MSIDKLPQEILSKILRDHLGTSHLRKEHLFVCKLWYFLIKPIIYEEISLNGSNLEKLQIKISSLTKSNSDLKSYFRVFPHTKKLRICDNKNSNGPMEDVKPLDSVAFLFLISLFPALKDLDIVYCEYKIHYLEFLYACDVKKLPLIENLQVEDTNKPIAEIDFDKLYFSVLYKFRNTLTSLSMRYTRDYSLDYGRGILDILTSFKNLTGLKFSNCFDRNMTVFHLLKALPRLENIVFYSDYNDSQNADAILKSLFQDIKEKGSTPPDYFKNMRVLEIRQSGLTKLYMDFFTIYCLPNLQRLHFQLNNTDFYNWITEVSLPTALKFARYLSKLDHSRIAFGEMNDDLIVTRDSPRFGERIDNFYQFLIALKGNIPGRIYNANFIDMWDPLCPSANFVSSEEVVNYYYTLNHVDYGLDPNDDSIREFNSFNSFNRQNRYIPYHKYPVPVPSSHLLGELELISNLTFSVQLPRYEYLPKTYFDYAVKYCNNLNQFEVRYKDPRCQLIMKQKPGVRSQLKDMHSATLGGTDYSQDMLNILHRYTPNIDTFKYATFSNYDTELGELIFNLSKFEKLQNFILDFWGIVDMGFEYIFVQIKREGSKKMVNYILEEDSDGDFELKPTSADFIDDAIDEGEAYLIFIKAPRKLEKVQFEIGNIVSIGLDLKDSFGSRK